MWKYDDYKSISIGNFQCLFYYLTFEPPHSTSVNPFLWGVSVSFGAEIETYLSDDLKAINTRIIVSGFGLIFNFALSVYVSFWKEMII